MKRTIAILLILFPFFCSAEDNFLHMMVQGKYILVGKVLDSNATYHGKVEIADNKGKLVVVREINGRCTKGIAAIESALNGDAKVLRIRFKESEINFEQTCMVGSDLDNYARISCYLYQPKIRTMQPGLEVLFYDHTAK
ncbi:hypothetical protein [uncultured Thalassolituus sp.]|uniref:hypothetical protein n=1 Tax=uncultured Thalassolituus sp. TaxID=285273 RepID=UPI00260C1C5E|nr:hypothetical protein [uncultured Thalassolituus sp.]